MNSRGRRQRLSSIHEIADELRQSAEAAAPAPDLTSAILGRVDDERPFLSRKTRSLVVFSRVALGAGALCVVFVIALANRWAPGAVELAPRAAPLSSVVQNVQSEAVVQFAGIRQSVENVARADVARTDAGSVGLLTLVVNAAPKPSCGETLTCSLVGPTMPPDVAARRSCCAERVTFCVDRPLADAPKFVCGSFAAQSPWTARRSRVVFAADSAQPMTDDSLPVLVGPELDAILAPK